MRRSSCPCAYRAPRRCEAARRRSARTRTEYAVPSSVDSTNRSGRVKTIGGGAVRGGKNGGHHRLLCECRQDYSDYDDAAITIPPFAQSVETLPSRSTSRWSAVSLDLRRSIRGRTSPHNFSSDRSGRSERRRKAAQMTGHVLNNTKTSGVHVGLQRPQFRFQGFLPC